MIVNLARTVTVPDGPNLPPGLVDQVKEFLLAIHFQNWFVPVVAVAIGVALFIYFGFVGKLVMLAVGGTLLYGWGSDGGFVRTANMLSSDSGMLTVLVVGGGLALHKFSKAKRGWDRRKRSSGPDPDMLKKLLRSSAPQRHRLGRRGR